MSVTNPDQVAEKKCGKIMSRIGSTSCRPGPSYPLPPVPSHYAAKRSTLCGENATDQGGKSETQMWNNKLQATLVQNYDPPTHSLTGVRRRATSVAKKNSDE